MVSKDTHKSKSVFIGASPAAEMEHFCKWFACVVIIIQLANGHYVLDLSSPDWSVYNANQTILTVGPVPGGVYSTLRLAGNISDLLYGKNDLNYRWIGRDDWNYFRNFEMTASQLDYPFIELVLHGVDTVADVYLNSKYLLSCNNMFLRYTADIKPYLKEGKNNITLLFKSPIEEAKRRASGSGYVVPPTCHPADYKGECSINMLRKMQASFSWDWGPAFPSVGIWKPVEIVMSNGPVINSVKVFTVPDGLYWNLTVIVGFDPSDRKAEDVLVVELTHDVFGYNFTSENGINFSEDTKEITVDLRVPQFNTEMWWPNGYGEPVLYNLTVYTSHSQKTVQFGFRTIELIQENVSTDESKGKTFYLVVNGVKMFAKGSNWIPSHVLPERLSDPERVVPLLEAGAASNFNMLRVWGGGVYESDLFYRTCDRLGILVWQDFMFACSMYPATDEFLENVKTEVRQQVDRLQHHPSIAIWAGNNENEGALVDNWYGTSSNFSLYRGDYVKLYVDTIMPLVRELDPSREYLTSSPSNGLHSQAEGYVSKNPGNPLYGDVHFYDYVADSWDPATYPRPRFASEFGVQSLPSLHCLQTALPEQEMHWGSDLMQHRQHAPNGNSILTSQIQINLPPANNLNDIIYLSQINQAMAMKTESEKYRRLKDLLLESGEGYTMGALYWQLNDIWQAPSWASIDYCGHWKMVQYYAKEFFYPIIVSPELSADGTQLSLYVVIDGDAIIEDAVLTLNIHNWSSKDWNSVQVYTDVKLEINKSFVAYQVTLSDALANCGKKEDCFLTTTLEIDDGLIAPENFLFLTHVKDSNYPETSVKITNISQVDNSTAELTLTADTYALFVWLELYELKGTFSRNGFHMTQPITKVTFTSEAPLDLSILERTTVTWLKRSYA